MTEKNDVGKDRPRAVADAKNESNFDALARNLRSMGEGHSADDMATLMAKGWKKIVGMLIVALFLVWMGQQFVSSRRAVAGNASAEFSRIQDSFLVGGSDSKEQTDKSGSIVKTAQSNLATTYAGTPYAKLSKLYEALDHINNNRLAEASAILQDVTKAAEKRVGGKDAIGSVELFAGELGRLIDARAMASVESNRAAARDALLLLGREGAFTNVDAIVNAYDLSEGLAEEKVVVEQARALRLGRPEFGALLDDAFRARGVSL